MKPLVLDSSMTSMGGVFYPTGHIFVLLPDEDCARQAEASLHAAGFRGDIAYAGAETILQDVVRTLGNADSPLPSVGAEGDIVRRIADLAARGYNALLVQMTDNDNTDALVEAVLPAGAAAAFYYRTFIIEDLITQPPSDARQSVMMGTHASSNKPS